ncbi:DgyrCDS9656 [Dimorphilus gyrociliatus]|uniref:DgyrCDS9656 n=1 Tax=Dimorphilus gyrociliatus TaxID=2664684 RepID=A0A7I8VY01_9ANNE|nr:DgyrCDS9656 [Dimorphilus gyrociliatus]
MRKNWEVLGPLVNFYIYQHFIQLKEIKEFLLHGDSLAVAADPLITKSLRVTYAVQKKFKLKYLIMACTAMCYAKDKYDLIADVDDNFEINSNSTPLSALFYGFSGKKLKIITTLAYKPFLYRNNQKEIVGSLKNTIDIMAEKLNFKYDFLVNSSANFGERLSPGVWSGVIGQVTNKTASILADGLSYVALDGRDNITYDRSKDVSFTFPYYIDSISALYRAPDPENNILYFIHIFKYDVWALAGSACLVTALIYTAITHLTAKISNCESRVPVYDSLFFFLGSFWKQAMSKLPQHSSGRLVLSFWWLFIIMFTTVYSGMLMASLTVVLRDIPFKDFAELTNYAAANEKVLVFVKDSAILDLVKKTNESENHPFQMAKDNIYSHKDSVVTNSIVHGNPELLEKLKDFTHIFFGDKVNLQQFAASLGCNKDKLILLQKNFLSSGLGLVVHKGSPFVKRLSKLIMLQQESGLIELWIKQNEEIDYCPFISKQVAKKTKVKLEYVPGVFILFGFGVGVALAILIAEMILTILKNRKITTSRNNQIETRPKDSYFVGSTEVIRTLNHVQSSIINGQSKIQEKEVCVKRRQRTTDSESICSTSQVFVIVPSEVTKL